MDGFELNSSSFLMDSVDEDATKEKPTNSSAFGLSIVMTAVTHPIAYVKLLIQVGHEPLPVQQGTTFFGRKILRLPNFVQYAQHIRSVDGWFGLYRGLGANIAHNIISLSVTNAINKKVKEENVAAGKLAVDDSTVTGFLQETCNATVAKTTGIVVSYPFHVIGVRMMVQFIGRETQYNTIYSSVKEIYNEEGISGFFVGLVPHLIGELLGLWLFKSLNYVIVNYLIGTGNTYTTEIQNYTVGLSQYLVSLVTYPFQLVTSIMVVNDTNLSAGRPPLMPLYSSWRECWIELGKRGLRSRGSTLFRRTLPVPVSD